MFNLASRFWAIVQGTPAALKRWTALIEAGDLLQLLLTHARTHTHTGDLLHLLLTSASLSRGDLTMALAATVKRGLVPETELLLRYGACASVCRGGASCALCDSCGVCVLVCVCRCVCARMYACTCA